jgi:hypothetical protein
MSCPRPEISLMFTGELRHANQTALRDHVRGCKVCRAQYDRFGEAMVIFEGQTLPHATTQHLVETFESERTMRRWPWAIAAAVLLSALAWQATGDLQAPSPTLLARGGTAPMADLRVFCINPDGNQPAVVASARSGGVIRCPADHHLQFAVSTDAPGFLGVYSLGRGEFRWYHRDQSMQPVIHGVDQRLPGSIRLLDSHPPGAYEIRGYLGPERRSRHWVESQGGDLPKSGIISRVTLLVEP